MNIKKLKYLLIVAFCVIIPLRSSILCMEGEDVISDRTPTGGIPFAEEMICPITLEPMKNPGVNSIGRSYEIEALTEWNEKHNTDPMTNQEINPEIIIPNDNLRILIRDWAETINGVVERRVNFLKRMFVSLSTATAATVIYAGYQIILNPQYSYEICKIDQGWLWDSRDCHATTLIKIITKTLIPDYVEI